MKYSQESLDDKVKVTHTLKRKTRNAVRELVTKGEVKDASAFIEEAVQKALKEQRLKQLDLELEAFEDENLVARTVQEGEDGLEDMANALGVYDE